MNVFAAPNYDQELIDLLSALIATPSFSGEELPVQKRIARWFSDQGIESKFEDAEDGLKNLTVTINGRDNGLVLWIGGHCDTVGIAADWTRKPHAPSIDGNRLYGLGSMDMKGGLAAAMLAVRALFRRRHEWSGSVIFSALADEEAYSRGANAFVRTSQRIDAALMCEPHFDDVVIGAMGKTNIRVEVRGKSAHGSRPEKGVNAVTEAARLIAAIGDLERQDHPEFGRPTHCVLNVTSGDRAYEIRVPDFAAFVINWHFMPGETVDQAVETIHSLIDDLGSSATFEVTVGEPRYESFYLGKDHPFVTQFAQVYKTVIGKDADLKFGRGVSDANIFTGRANIPTLLFGPGGANMHAGDEWVDIDQLHLARDLYLEFALKFMQAKTESPAK